MKRNHEQNSLSSGEFEIVNQITSILNPDLELNTNNKELFFLKKERNITKLKKNIQFLSRIPITEKKLSIVEIQKTISDLSLISHQKIP